MGFYPFEKGDIKKSGYICTPFLGRAAPFYNSLNHIFFTH